LLKLNIPLYSLNININKNDMNTSTQTQDLNQLQKSIHFGIGWEKVRCNFTQIRPNAFVSKYENSITGDEIFFLIEKGTWKVLASGDCISDLL